MWIDMNNVTYFSRNLLIRFIIISLSDGFKASNLEFKLRKCVNGLQLMEENVFQTHTLMQKQNCFGDVLAATSSGLCQQMFSAENGVLSVREKNMGDTPEE